MSKIKPEQVPYFARHVADTLTNITGRYIELYRALYPTEGQPAKLNPEAMEGIRALSRDLCLQLMELSRKISVNYKVFDFYAGKMRDPRIIKPLIHTLAESYFLLTQLTEEKDLKLIADVNEIAMLLDGEIRLWLDTNNNHDKNPELGPAK